MHGHCSEVQCLLESIIKGAQFTSSEIIVFPSFVHLQQAQALLKNTRITWGAQNLYLGDKGAFTGEISGPMLVDCGCHFVLVGHSERRLLFHETVELVAAKFKAALHSGLQPILCVGETREQREQGKAEAVIQSQLQSVVEAAGIEAFQRAVIAYEPVWAIGTGLTATPDQAQEAHHLIRDHLAQYNIDVANRVRILYGGSVKADNAKGLLAMPDIDGGLVGGASLNAESFLEICRAAEGS